MLSNIINRETPANAGHINSLECTWLTCAISAISNQYIQSLNIYWKVFYYSKQIMYSANVQELSNCCHIYLRSMNNNSYAILLEIITRSPHTLWSEALHNAIFREFTDFEQKYDRFFIILRTFVARVSLYWILAKNVNENHQKTKAYATNRCIFANAKYLLFQLITIRKICFIQSVRPKWLECQIKV